MDERIGRVIQPLSQNRDLALVGVIIAVLIAILIPMPAMVMDVFLIFNITFALLIVLTTVYVRSPLDFSVFPSLLLMATLYRLALNVATTRLILGSERAEGEAAAGQVIQVFGNFVAGSDAIVGFVIFAVIVIIQFVVITKGATRIAEVAARFTLDKMPGQQLSIDADLNAGLIDEATARDRRERITAEADFYGAMDGASKFVRGDAIAGIVITLINVLGGFLIGITKQGLTFDQALKTFTVLTIGDGLVTQIPALIISIAAGLLVTRKTTDSNLGTDLIGQLFASPRAILITGGFLLLLLPTQLPWPILLVMILGFGAVGYVISGTAKDRAKEEAEAEEAPPEMPRADQVVAPPVDPLELEVGYGLVNLVDPGDGGGLLYRIGLIREQMATELGLVIPSVRIRDNMQFRPAEYAIKLRGQRIAGGEIKVDHFLAMDAGLSLEPIEGTATKEPAFGIDAVWVTAENRGRAEAMGYTVVDATSVLATHLTETIRDQAAEILTREEVNRMIDRLRETSPAVVSEVIPDTLKVGDVQKVLQGLLREKVSIRDMEAIFETLGDWAPRSKDPDVLTEYVRHRLGRGICTPYLDGQDTLRVVSLDPQLEDYIQNATEHNDRGSSLRLGPEIIGRIVQAVSKALESLVGGGHPPLVLTAPQVRLQVRRMLENSVPGVVVLSYNEVARGISIESLGVAKVE